MQENPIGNIYKISNDINDKLYIGKSQKSIDIRFKEHCRESKSDRFENRPLYKAMRKYGISHFKISLIESVPFSELCEREKYWISYYNSYKTGYNATLGGDGTPYLDDNYDNFISDYKNGILIKDIAVKYNCSVDAVSSILHNVGVDTSINQVTSFSKSVCVEMNKKLFHFNSLTEAAKWCIDMGLTTSSSEKGVAAVIGRVANKQRGSAYGLVWKYC